MLLSKSLYIFPVICFEHTLTPKVCSHVHSTVSYCNITLPVRVNSSNSTREDGQRRTHGQHRKPILSAHFLGCGSAQLCPGASVLMKSACRRQGHTHAHTILWRPASGHPSKNRRLAWRLIKNLGRERMRRRGGQIAVSSVVRGEEDAIYNKKR